MRRFLLFLAVCLLPFILILFRSSHAFVTHDGKYHLERTLYFVEGLKEGQWPPTWTSRYNNGFGSPIFLFLFPLPYVVSSLMFFITGQVINGVKLAFLVFTLMAVVGMYKWTKSKLAALAYIFSPYMISQMLVRGAYREYAALCLAPFLMWALRVGNPALIALTFSGVLMTDGVTVYVLAPMVVIYSAYLVIVSKKRWQTFFNMVGGGIWGILIASNVLVPFVTLLRYLKSTDGYVYSDHFVYIKQLFDYHWGFGFSMPGLNDGMSFQIGYINILIIIGAVYLLVRKKVKERGLVLLILGTIAATLFLLLRTSPTLWLYEKMSFLRQVQLPWRYMGVVSLLCAMLAGVVFRKIRGIKLGVLMALILLVNFRYLRANQVIVYEMGEFYKNRDDATAFHEFIPIWRQTTSAFDNFPNKVEFVTGSGEITMGKVNNREIDFTVNTTSAGVLRVNSLYFPGWRAWVNDKEVSVFPTTDIMKSRGDKRDVSGLMGLVVPEGRSNIVVRYVDLPVRRVTQGISIIALVFCVWYIKSKYSKKNI